MKKVFTAVLAVTAIVAGGKTTLASGLFNLGGCATYRCAPVRSCAPRCRPHCYRPANCCVTYETKELTCYKTVYETHWKDVPVTCYKYVNKTKWIEKTRTVCVPRTEYVTKQVPYTVCKPIYEKHEKEVTCYRCVPVTVQQTCMVDCGHWEYQSYGGCWDPCRPRCGGCGPCRPRCGGCGPCPTRRVWVPNLVEKTYPCTKYVREAYTKVVPYTTCRYEYEQLVRDVTYPVCRYDYVEKTYKVPVTYCETIPYQTTKRVAYCVPKQVAYTVTVCTPSYQPCCNPCY
ncbi:MAG: hypothetical protein MPJ50_02400 [Pirellulales bacterium]|nr:hypothetical protein [Pirellulales bacterium]